MCHTSRKGKMLTQGAAGSSSPDNSGKLERTGCSMGGSGLT